VADAFVKVERNQAVVHGLNIPELPGAPWGHTGKRPRRLLLHRHQIDQIARGIEREGMTCVVTLLYFRGGRAKLEIALGRGKKKVDKRETVKRRDADREAETAMAERRRW
jgi:SsrA-binding protein